MDTGIITPTGGVQKLAMFQIGPYLEGIVTEAIKKDRQLEKDYEYMESIMSRFNPAVMFALVKLNYKIIAPFAKSINNVLFSNGGTLFAASRDYVQGRYFAPELLDDKVGIQIPTDETIGYDPNFTNISNIKSGIIDDLGYIDSTFLDNYTKNDPNHSSDELLASLMLMNDMLFKEYVYKDVLSHRKRKTDLEFITSKPNCVLIKREPEGFSISYVSDNNGKVGDFLKKLDNEGLIAKYDMLPVPPADLTVQEENDLLVQPEIPALRVK